MNEQFDPNAEPSRPRESEGFGPQPGGPTIDATAGKTGVNGRPLPPRVDFWAVTDLVLQRWHWLAIGCILGAVALFELSWTVLIKPRFTADVQLFRYDTPGPSDSLKGSPLSPESFASLIVSPDLLRRVGTNVDPQIPPEKLVKQINVDPQPESDLVKVFVSAPDPQMAVELANKYAEETVAFTRDLQAQQASAFARNILKKEVGRMDQEITALHAQISGLPGAGQVMDKLTEVSNNLHAVNQNLAAAAPRPSIETIQLWDKLDKSKAELIDLTAKYTDINPVVQQKRAQIDALQKQLAESATNSALMPAGLQGLVTLASGGRVLDPNYEVNQAKLKSLQEARIETASRQLEAELFADTPPGVVRVFAPATLKTVQSNHRRIKTGLLTIVGGMFGMGCSLVLILFTEAVDSRLKTVDDLRRVTRLPVLTTLGNLDHMAPGPRTQWAFRTWTMLQGRLSRSQNHGLVCGITSSLHGEGRSTWIKLLAEAASLTGFRVLTIATKPSPGHVDLFDQLTEGDKELQPERNDADNGGNNVPAESNSQTAALTSNVLSTPSQVTERLTDPNSQPMVHIPLPGWVWNLDRRKQWRSALHQWRQIDNLVILVELPPASVPEAVLLGSNLPNLIWLADSGKADAGETRTQLETLRNARCNLVGSVLNRERSKPIKRRFPRWMFALALLAPLATSRASAQDTTAPLPIDAPAADRDTTPTANPATNLSFSVVSPAQRADWERRLTLGPGDVVNFALYGEPTLTRTEVAIAPDGRVSYLEAQDIMAAGLTVDELRAKIDEALGKYRRAARSIVTPAAYRSKKYFVLGQVVQRGVYTLDRPTTVLEAVARAHGIQNGQLENETVDLADFSHSFLMRGGKRYSLDFEKLFENGDLSQNIQIEPGDYLYFPSANVRQVYVLGEVGLPGPAVYRPDMTVLAAVATRGGFNEKAFKSRVLVIRGSLNHPETFVVDTMGVTTGRLPDFKLQPKDIVYVNYRPFYRAEDLLDLATTAFIQSIVTSWVGTDVVRP